MKTDRDLDRLAVPEAADHFLNRLNLGIKPFAYRMSDLVIKVRHV
jgi:hypothetical protein